MVLFGKSFPMKRFVSARSTALIVPSVLTSPSVNFTGFGPSITVPLFAQIASSIVNAELPLLVST